VSDGTPLGALLMREGLLTEAQLDAALSEQSRSGKQLGRILIESGTISETDLVRTLAKQVGLDYVDLTDAVIDASAVSLVTEGVARRYQALAIGWDNGRLVVAMADPSNVFALDDIRAITGFEVKTVVASPSALVATIDRYFRLDTEVDTVAQAAADEFSENEELSSVSEVVEDAPIVKFVNLLITQAVNDRASDIHVEPTEHDLRIRFRIDGVLHEVMRSPRSIQAGVISRLKVMAEINIAERRIPQDGRISMKVGGRSVDLRVATLPIVYGEKVVMRILDKGQAILRLEDLGFLPETLERFSTAYHKPYGTILVTGPTGSGKSTTLYATLNILNEPHRNIITVEDPVEYRLAGINQVQVHPKAGLTFASALRSILRADPDVILVGEIRDVETARIAVQSALTGHLVLSSLHATDAVAALHRFLDMGIESFLIASSVMGIVGQRLLRRICPSCRVTYTPPEEELAFYTEAGGAPKKKFWIGEGCNFCAETGYQDRIGVYELLQITPEIKRLIVGWATQEELRRLAVSQGMVTLRDEALRLVTDDVTTISEVIRSIYAF
jgi:type IV pilus assembly protein PilB